VLAELIARWPALQQQAFIRLAIGEVVARRLFGEDRPRDLLGLVCVSRETGVGKTLLARFIARAVGLEDERVVVRLPHRAVGDVLGRVDHRGEVRRFMPAAVLSHPLAVFDEVDKADHERWLAALAVLDHGFRFEREGELHVQRAVPMLTANKVREMPEYACRRAIVLDLDPAFARAETLGSRSSTAIWRSSTAMEPFRRSTSRRSCRPRSRSPARSATFWTGS
jgi:MoxR-like ATPase